ncbi:hypothetical protein C7389_1012 [Azoarcus indigens]|uniref:Uncharacterized protein n=1 Tax=Azoarcus indigens TaxID=29545 RepID=A0A4R6EGD6_9RHOO|nr:hypothetical protein C7389_1012 [Azoarcus indigens]
MIGTWQKTGTEGLAIGTNTPHREPAEVDSMIGTLTAYKTRPLPLPSGPVISKSYFQCSISRLRPGVGKENPIQVSRRQGGQPLRERDRLIVSGLKTYGVVQRCNLSLDCSNDTWMTMP